MKMKMKIAMEMKMPMPHCSIYLFTHSLIQNSFIALKHYHEYKKKFFKKLRYRGRFAWLAQNAELQYT